MSDRKIDVSNPAIGTAKSTLRSRETGLVPWPGWRSIVLHVLLLVLLGLPALLCRVGSYYKGRLGEVSDRHVGESRFRARFTRPRGLHSSSQPEADLKTTRARTTARHVKLQSTSRQAQATEPDRFPTPKGRSRSEGFDLGVSAFRPDTRWFQSTETLPQEHRP